MTDMQWLKSTIESAHRKPMQKATISRRDLSTIAQNVCGALESRASAAEERAARMQAAFETANQRVLMAERETRQWRVVALVAVAVVIAEVWIG